MFKLLFLLCFYPDGKSKKFYLLGLPLRVCALWILALSQAATSAPRDRKLGNTKEALEIWHKPYFGQFFFGWKW
jgi:hypothetical protein